MIQNRKRQNTNRETTREKHACPITVFKHNQGTGKNRFDPQTQKTTDRPSGSADTKDPKDGNRIWTRTEYDASPYLDSIINTFDTKRNGLAAWVINFMREYVVNLITEHLRNQGIPYNTLDGETFTLTLRFAKEVPEGA